MMQKQKDKSGDVLEKIITIDKKIKQHLRVLNKLQDETDFISTILRYAYAEKDELMKMVEENK